MSIIINIAIIIANIIYLLFKIIPTNKHKITFISRQSNQRSIDFTLLKEELLKQDKTLKIIELYKTIDNGLINKIKYCFHIIRQMYHIATSKIVILDSYCIPICILKHKKSLTVIQMWHALGSLKKFGYSSLDTKDGRDSKIAKLMHMHQNYDYILTSSAKALPNFQEAFKAQKKQMVIMNLPRVDYLKNKAIEKQLRKEFYLQYPKIDQKKKNILYCPTSRKNHELPLKEIVSSVDYDKYNLIIKLHDNTNYIYYNEDEYYDKIVFSGIDFLHIADYIITDYSAIVYEAVITKKPIYLYTFDYEEYIDERGLYLNYQKEMPGIISKDINKIMQSIKENKVDNKKQDKFIKDYLTNLEENWTEKLAKFIIAKL